MPKTMRAYKASTGAASAPIWESTMRYRKEFSALFMAMMMLLATPVNAQESCNIKEMLAALKKENSADGPGQFYVLVRSALKKFNQHLLELMNRPDMNPPGSDRHDAIEEKTKKFANIDEDEGQLEDLLKDALANASDFGPPRKTICNRCRLLPAWRVFRDAGYPFVTAAIVDSMKSLETYKYFKVDAQNLKEELAGQNREDIVATLRDSIRGYLGAIRLPGETASIKWTDRYGTNSNPKMGKDFADSVKNLGKTQCGDVD
jgi:hypothetical protein